jgi:ribosomal protein S18 acetylase RimI-like enzyme
VIVGFVSYELRDKDQTGEVMLLAVHPDHQNLGMGTEQACAGQDAGERD